MSETILKPESLDIRPLYYFVQVASLGSFSRASSALSLSQPMLSKYIRRLESQMQVQLLHRDGRGVRATHAGLKLLESGRAILSTLSQAETQVAAFRDASLGTVWIASLPLMGAIMTAPLITRLRRDFPLINTGIREGFAAEVLDWLSNGLVDIGIVYNPPPIATLILDHLLDDRLCLVGTTSPPGFERSAAVPANALGKLPLVLPPPPHRLRGLVEDAAKKASVEIKPVADVTGTCTIFELVRAGIGYTVFPSLLLREEIKLHGLWSRPIVEPSISPQLYIVTSMQRPQTKATQVVIKLIRELLRKQGKTMGRVAR